MLSTPPLNFSYEMIEKGKSDITFAKKLIEFIESNTINLNGYNPITIYCVLGSAHLEIANNLLKNKLFLAKCNGSALAEICSHRAIAEEIFNNPELLNLLDGSNLSKIGADHIDIAKKILDSKELSDRCNGNHLALMGHVHYEIAKKIFNSEPLVTKCRPDNLTRMARAHVEIANTYQSYLRENCSPKDLFSITLAHTKHNQSRYRLLQQKEYTRQDDIKSSNTTTSSSRCIIL